MMNSSTELGIHDYIGLVRRRKWLILSVVTVAMAIATVLCVILPKSFRSTTTILVESQKIPESYVKSGVEGTIEGRINSIQQIVMSRSLLTKIAEDFNFFRPDTSPEERESIVSGMRKSIRVNTAETGHVKGRNTIEAFSISFANEDALTAMKVTERFAEQFIEQNLKFREQLLEGTSSFLAQELRLAEAKLEDQERSISEFKRKFMGELPQQMEANLRSLDRLQMDVNSTRENIQTAMNRVGILEKQVNEAVSGARTQGATESISTNQGRVGDPLISRLSELERTLTTLSAEYRQTYPDIVQARQEIEAVKDQLALKYGVSKDEVKAGSAKLIDPVLRDQMRQRDEAKNELEVLKERLRRLIEQVKQYEGRVERVPAREQELMILIRDYDNMQKNYQSLLDKSLNARLAENLEKRQKGEQFRVLDPANLPATPESPNRLFILLGGLFVGCGIGFGAAFGIDLLRPSFRRPEEAESFLGLPILAGIPSFSTLPGAKWSLPVSPALSTPLTQDEKNRKALQLSYGRKGQNGSGSTALVKGASAQDDASWNLISKWWPNSMIAEQYRVAATRLALMSTGQQHSVALITSSLMGEGKSSTAINLSHVFAQGLDKKTLIIDCDLKRPAVSKYLAMPSGPGLADYWAGTHTIDECLHKMGDIPLWVLPAGTRSEKVIELSKVRQLEQLLDEMRPRFDQIILDAPPVFPLADLNFLSRMADVMVFVIQAGKTSRDVVEKAMKSLRPQCQVGIILAGVESMSIPSYQCHYDDPVGARYVEGK
ncbi:MAG: AAA family ATPase [Nitrospirota bacterium]|nr:AAA family ATPase [Nitrospirota bacterium]MDP2382708.1 AAA family ATPase [Nitrospirota bacterium]MDP3597105.1 AAA family ATPase [Nitrospirota bacterium]